MLPSSPSTTSDLAVTGVSAQWRTGCAAGQKLRNTRESGRRPPGDRVGDIGRPPEESPDHLGKTCGNQSPGRSRAGGGSAGVMPFREIIQDGADQDSEPAHHSGDGVATGVNDPPPGRHPLPCRNQPCEGDKPPTDANGEPVYDGADAAEMFRLYGRQAGAEAAGKNEGRG